MYVTSHRRVHRVFEVVALTLAILITTKLPVVQGAAVADFTEGESFVNNLSVPLLIAAMNSRSAVVELNTTLNQPWSLAFLPDGRLLVTQKTGKLLILDAEGGVLVDSVNGLPTITDAGQGGLLDVLAGPSFTTDRWIYLSFTEPGSDADFGLSGTAVARGRLQGGSLVDMQVIFRQSPKLAGHGHFGSRLAFAPDGTLFVTLGDRRAQDLVQRTDTSIGKVVRINTDGSVPLTNPEIGGERTELWSLGHRNPQGAAIHPTTGELWISEHGPQGGDEVNRVVGGGNYGWPEVSYGCNYGEPVGSDCEIGGGVHAPTYFEPLSIWRPTSMAPAGMSFYTGQMFPDWEGHLLLGALSGRVLWRIIYDGNREIARLPLLALEEERVRDVSPGPEGNVYLLTDSGKLLRLAP